MTEADLEQLIQSWLQAGGHLPAHIRVSPQAAQALQSVGRDGALTSAAARYGLAWVVDRHAPPGWAVIE